MPANRQIAIFIAGKDGDMVAEDKAFLLADPRLCFVNLCHATLSQSGLAPNSHILKSARMALAPRANPATPTTAQPSVTRQQQPANSQQQPTDTNATHHNQEADPTSASSAAADGTAADALCSPACTWVDIQNLNSRVLDTLEAFPDVHQLQLVCEPRGAGVVARSVISRSAPGAGPPLPPWLRRVAKVAVTVAKVVLALEAGLLLSDMAGVSTHSVRRFLRRKLHGQDASSSDEDYSRNGRGSDSSTDEGPQGSSEEALEGVVGFLAGVLPPEALQALQPAKVRAALQEVDTELLIEAGIPEPQQALAAVRDMLTALAEEDAQVSGQAHASGAQGPGQGQGRGSSAARGVGSGRSSGSIGGLHGYEAQGSAAGGTLAGSVTGSTASRRGLPSIQPPTQEEPDASSHSGGSSSSAEPGGGGPGRVGAQAGEQLPPFPAAARAVAARQGSSPSAAPAAANGGPGGGAGQGGQ